MKNTARTQNKNSQTNKSNAGAFAAPLAVAPAMALTMPQSPSQVATETDRRMLLVRLSDAADKIRKETELIQRTSFSDPAGRLLRILAETVEEQRLSFGAARGAKK